MSAATAYQAYYTKSEPILKYMTDMLHLKPQDTIWEPCGGDGAFVDKILEVSPSSNISVFELNPQAADYLRYKYHNCQNIHIKLTDTLLDNEVINRSYQFDKIIGNPPYGAKHTQEKQITLNKVYANLYSKESYTLFLYACIECLKENGELSFIIPDTFLSLHRHLAIRRYILTHTIIRELTLFPSSFFPGINFGYANLCIITLKKSNDVLRNLSNNIQLRTGFSHVSEISDVSAGTTRIVSQNEIYNQLDSAFMFDAPNWINDLINDTKIERIEDIAHCVTGFYSGDDKQYLHPLNEECKNAKKYIAAKSQAICTRTLSKQEEETGINGGQCLIPIVKGGNRKFFKPNEWFMDWSQKAVSEYRNSKKCRFQNSSFYFQEGIAIPMIRSKQLTAALIEKRLFDQSIVGVFPKDKSLTLYLLAFLNSSICTKLIKAINPSTNNSANYIKKIPFIRPSEETIREVQNIVTKILSHLRNGVDDVSIYENQLNIIFDELYSNATSHKTYHKQSYPIIQLSMM